MTANVPISDTGTAISGISVARTLPRNRKTTIDDQDERLDQGVDHLVDALLHERRRVVGDLVGDALRELGLHAFA